MKKPSDKPVRVAVLKARLSEYIRAARRGHQVTVYDRDTPVARLVPYETGPGPLMVREALRPLRDVSLPPPLARKIDSLSALLDERQPSR